jgi:hypothetical protein
MIDYTANERGQTAAIAVLSWTWAAVAVQAAPRPAPVPVRTDERSLITCGS